ncbi:hypothetical protein BDV33DRAFT_180703 [Aspergillus novoparasiticus]|uniref:Uncharacterized protein n=1 Tax=Aspergillus novoparasiticus TaxID=986946 RepID=A0A5N6EGH6_9EURO|nr:hypothetical protein BDV33DRAFT_180703 [Aspergillus novoparasiticus]
MSSAIVTVDDRKNYLWQILVLFVDYLVFTCIVSIYAHPQLRTVSGTILLPLFRTMGGEKNKGTRDPRKPFPHEFPVGTPFNEWMNHSIDLPRKMVEDRASLLSTQY